MRRHHFCHNFDGVFKFNYTKMTDIYSIFNTPFGSSTKCTQCHGSSGNFTLTTYADLMDGGSNNGWKINFNNAASPTKLLMEKAWGGSTDPMEWNSLHCRSPFHG